MIATIENPKVASRAEWIAARRTLLAKEKELTRARDALAAQRRQLPWVKIEKTYVFDGPHGRETLADLFAGRSQLIIYHFMFGPGWKEGCVGCSFLADHLQGALVHLENHDVSVVVVSRAPLAEIQPFHRRMGWPFKWVSSHASDFNFDYHVSFTEDDIEDGKVYHNYGMRDFMIDELSGTSVFARDEAGDVFHTYSTYARGDEPLLGAYFLLDLTPKGRHETGPSYDLSDWVRHHDRYGTAGHVAPTGRFIADEQTADCGCGAAQKK
jgi:predicted dithiol-disulfide oxidoreductase (DUF899 family)